MACMPYIIDGHNIIPKIPGLYLDALDDEVQLIEMLQDFCRKRRKKVEVYFDNAPPGQLRVRKYGAVTAHFVRSGQTADAAIHARLQRLGGAARNWTVVSSDQAVQASAKAARAQALSGEAFTQELTRAMEDTPAEIDNQGEKDLTPDELEDWLKLFGEEKSQD